MSNKIFYLKHTCLCGKYRDELDRDKGYTLPKPHKSCNICKEPLEWRVIKIEG